MLNGTKLTHSPAVDQDNLGKWQKHNTQEILEGSPFPEVDHKKSGKIEILLLIGLSFVRRLTVDILFIYQSPLLLTELFQHHPGEPHV